MRMLSRTLLAVAFAAQSLMAQPGATQGTSPPRVDVLAVGSTADHQVSLVAALRPLPLVPLGKAGVIVTSGGTNLPTRVQPVLSGRTAIGLVVDASAAGARSVQGGGLSGAASFLLQVPPDASTAVIADRRPPTVASTTSTGATEDLQAVSALRSDGVRATSDALTLALRQLPPWPGTQPVIVLYTSAPDAGGEAAPALGERVRRAHAILAVVTTSPDPQYWSRAAAATGGLAVVAEPTHAIDAFDELADALRARYVVTFPRPPASAAQVNLRFDTAGKPFMVALAMPPEPGVASAGAARSSSDTRLSGPAWFWVLGVAGFLVVAIVIILRRRRAMPSDGRVPAPETPPRGLRIFDLTQPGGPREITDSLFEERTLRDARERALTADGSPADIPPGPTSGSSDGLRAQHHTGEDPGR
jgi:hypothetical protein